MRTLAMMTLLVACQRGDGDGDDVVPTDGAPTLPTPTGPTPTDPTPTDPTPTVPHTGTTPPHTGTTPPHTGTTPTDTTDTGLGCAYPPGAVEPMTFGEVLTPYSWPVARHLDGLRSASLDLAQAPCAADDDIDWSPHDVLLFISIPAW